MRILANFGGKSADRDSKGVFFEEASEQIVADKKRRILFLCTANAARSQMSEALAKLHHGERVDAYSAGSRPGGFVHPLAIEAMTEVGADMSAAYSKSADEFAGQPFDVVVTVCDSAAQDCPLWPNAQRVEHWPVVDPSYGPDDPATRLDRFRATREELKQRIASLMMSL